MTTPLAIPSLERPGFFDGQRLDAADLGAIYDFHRAMRWLHNRALHGWGIAAGLHVRGAKGDREVTVAPGYALDCEGNDIVLTHAATLQVPPVAGSPNGGPAHFHLTASYQADGELAASETRAGVCHDGGAVRRVEAPRLRWQNPNDVSSPDTRFRRGLDIVLASVQVERCELAAAPGTAERRDARPAAQPYLAAGQTDPAKTAWALYPANGPVLGVETVVDTAAARFGTTPAYSAHVMGARRLPIGGAPAAGQLVDGFASVVDPTPVGFVLRVMLPRALPLPPYTLNPEAILDAKLPSLLSTQLRWSVAWMGVEGGR